MSGDPIDDKKSEAFGSVDDYKAAYSCVRFLLLSAVRFNIGKDIFSVELQQLGLPREHSQALGKILEEHSAALTEHLRSRVLTINELVDVKCTESDGIDCVKLQLETTNTMPANRTERKEINVSKSDIPILLKELKLIKQKMDDFDYENQ